MKGKILDYSIQTNEGIISAEDGNRYTFSGSEWKGSSAPATDLTVDFEPRESSACGVYVVNPLSPNAGSSAASRDTQSNKRIIASLLAFFLGGLGIHKFYLGASNAGIIMLLACVFGFLLLFVPTIIVYVIGFIEGIIYISKSDAEFEQTYVDNTKAWF